jgi:hypothetical protein
VALPAGIYEFEQISCLRRDSRTGRENNMAVTFQFVEWDLIIEKDICRSISHLFYQMKNIVDK